MHVFVQKTLDLGQKCVFTRVMAVVPTRRAWRRGILHDSLQYIDTVKPAAILEQVS